MDYHHNARLVIYSREQLAKSVLEGRLGLCEAAAAHRVSRQSAAKWVRRYRLQGLVGLADCSSRPHRSPRRTAAHVVQRVELLRRERRTGVQIAQLTGLSRATVSRILTRLKLNKIRMLEPKLPPNRYEHPCPGDLLHIDIKNWPASTGRDTASPAIPRTRPAAPDGSSSTSPSMTTPAWHMWP